MKDALAIVTISLDRSIIKDFLESLSKQKNEDFHLFITDISGEESRIDHKDVSLTAIKCENKGFSHNLNVALKEALEQNHQYFCIINDDTFFDENFVESVIDSLQKHSNALIGGKIYYAQGFEYHKKRYAKEDWGKVIWSAGGGVNWKDALPYHRGVDEVDRGQYDTFDEVDSLTGALLMFDRSVVDTVGLWDERYFLYYEDADWCERAKRAGIKLYYDPSVVLWHKVSQSTGGSGSLLNVYHQRQSRLRFGLTYAPLSTKFYLLKNYLFNFLKRKNK